MKKLVITLLFIVLSAAALADSGRITLLTVTSEGDLGGTADLYLTVRPGTGAIFIDSFPLTRVDTQSSVRYANRIACDILQTECDRYDFFYTIRANSAIVGGPSAGAAITVLTVAVLDNQPLDQHAAMTGTINSGGIIGPVAGISSKISGAKSAGITTVIIPSLTAPDEMFPNTSVTSTVRAGIIPELSNGITVIGATTVEDALQVFTGKNYTRELPPLDVPASYADNMRRISEEICTRTGSLEQQVIAGGLQYNDTNNYTSRIIAIDGNDYSRASLCFSKNIELATLLLQNVDSDARDAVYGDLLTSTYEFNNEIANRSIDTISDLEAYAIVKERILEAQGLLEEMVPGSVDPAQLAYAQERLVSARSWSAFFGIGGEQFTIDQLHLQRACLAKLSEADERINYVKLYAQNVVLESERLLAEAQEYSDDEPILCIFTASKAKAQANLLANAISVDQQSVDVLVQQKLAAASVVLQKQQEKDLFPILGYSYAQYAGDLRSTNPYSALTFSEYSLELSNLDMYFPKERGFRLPSEIVDGFVIFSFGVLFGAAVIYFVMNAGKKR